MKLEERLRAKGWSEEDIAHAVSILEEGGDNKTRQKFINKMNPIIYWIALLVSIIGNILIAALLIPFLLFLTGQQIYLIIGVLGITFGVLFNFIINDIEHIDPAHHVIAWIFIPALAIITVFVMVNVANNLSFQIQSPIHQNPILISSTYVISFILPYVLFKLISMGKHKT